MFFRLLVLTILLGMAVGVMPGTLRAQTGDLVLFWEQAYDHVPELKALDLEAESLRFEIKSRDLELSPEFQFEVNRFWDDRPSLSSNYQTDAQTAEMTVSKPFASGTTLSLQSALETAEYSNSPGVEQNLVNWQIGLSQSLWQNSFGRQVSLRRKRDTYEWESRYLALMEKRQRLLFNLESHYWDIVFYQQEVEYRKANLGRSQKILEWITDRLRRSAAEAVDKLQVEALVHRRELELLVANDQLASALARLDEWFEGRPELAFSVDGLRADRDPLQLTFSHAPASDVPQLISALGSRAQSEFLRYRSKFEADQLKPDLQVGYSYGQQGLSTSSSQARSDAFSSGQDYHKVGVTFSVPLDFKLTRQSRLATEYAARAQELRSVQSRQASVISWEDLTRTIEQQRLSVARALELARIQSQKSAEERDRYEKGRSTVFQLTTFEEDAAESELMALRMMAQLRRTEAQARLFARGSGQAHP